MKTHNILQFITISYNYASKSKFKWFIWPITADSFTTTMTITTNSSYHQILRTHLYKFVHYKIERVRWQESHKHLLQKTNPSPLPWRRFLHLCNRGNKHGFHYNIASVTHPKCYFSHRKLHSIQQKTFQMSALHRCSQKLNKKVYSVCGLKVNVNKVCLAQ